MPCEPAVMIAMAAAATDADLGLTHLGRAILTIGAFGVRYKLWLRRRSAGGGPGGTASGRTDSGGKRGKTPRLVAREGTLAGSGHFARIRLASTNPDEAPLSHHLLLLVRAISRSTDRHRRSRWFNIALTGSSQGGRRSSYVRSAPWKEAR